MPSFLPSFLPSSSASSPPTEKFHHKRQGETTRLSSLTYLHRYAYVKDISQSRMPFPSLQTAPGTTVIGQETPFMHLLMSNEPSPHSHLQPSQFFFPGRSPAQSITTTPPLLTAPWSYPCFSSTTTSSSAVRLALFNKSSSRRTTHSR